MDLFLRTIKDNNDPTQVGRPDRYWGQGTNDLVVDTTGDFAVTQGVDCLNQSVAKILTTERGDNIFTPMYGSVLYGLIGTNIDIDYLRATVKTDLIDTLRIYQFINKNNPNLSEQIDTLQSVAIDLGADSRSIQVSFRVITRSGLITGSTVQIEG